MKLVQIYVSKFKYLHQTNQFVFLYQHPTNHSLQDGSWLNSCFLIMSINCIVNFICDLNSWNEWVTLPVRFSDLPPNAQLCLTVLDCCGPSKMIPVGGTTIQFFGKSGVFRQV